jgi:methylthioribose-1-phosphate isomerase
MKIHPGKGNSMPVNTIEWINDKVRIIDQTELPLQKIYKEYSTPEEVWEAIKKLRVRGAPAIGVAGAFGVVLGIQKSRATTYPEFKAEFDKVADYLKGCRPTAVNLAWAIERMRKTAAENADLPLEKLINKLKAESLRIYEEDRQMCRRMGEFGASLLKDGDTVLTHCNAGGLATSDYGTALAVIYRAAEQGKHIKVYADETRPLLQGARLTTWELMENQIDVTLICDNMAAMVMKQGKINAIFVGADRIAKNGDTANKIGTYSVAINANFHHIPFYIVAPQSTIDFAIPDGNHIPIEERPAEEIICGFGKQTAPTQVKTYNPAFDVTPNELITGWVTDRGIIKPPFLANAPLLFPEAE